MLQQYWVQGQVPIINGILFSDGKLVRIELRKNEGLFLERDELRMRNIETSEINILVRKTIDESTFCSGDGSFGGDGFVAKFNPRDEVEWVVFFETFNPIVSIESLEPGVIIVTNNCADRWKINWSEFNKGTKDPICPIPKYHGIHFDGWSSLPALQDISNPAYLQHTNPWFRFSFILERAKKGDFSYTTYLPELWKTKSALYEAATTLFSCLAKNAELWELAAELKSPDCQDPLTLAEAAMFSGSLIFVNSFIKPYDLSFGETTRAAMASGFEHLLGEPFRSNENKSAEEIDRLIRNQEERFGRLSFYEGEPISVERLIREIKVLVYEDNVASLQMLLVRLQTMVGFSLDEMFNEELFGEEQTWNADVILSVLENVKVENFVRGKRYFWGHEAPF